MGTDELARIDGEDLFASQLTESIALEKYAARINKELAKVIDKEIIIYVHGAKGSFIKSVALTAEIDHFSGRDFVGLAFAWPSHQNILSYVIGRDVKRAEHSTASLRTLIEYLAEYTDAKQINVICYSAGGKLVSRALSEMREKYRLLDAQALRKSFKLGTVLFAAADIAVDRFLDRLPAISEMVQQVVVTVSDGDSALHFAGIVMGGKARIGTEKAIQVEEEFATEHRIDNFEIVDFSFGSDERGFDITGHHYWHRHPWASSDIMFLLRTDLPAKDRGLSLSDIAGVWYLPVAYPSQVRQAVKEVLKGEW
ncbi:MAG: esterase/lipase superfamily enzyme [Desulforhopalus sp.]|jgi:esterase/lipase superfamily enzyme